jgi:hypothetical protein
MSALLFVREGYTGLPAAPTCRTRDWRSLEGFLVVVPQLRDTTASRSRIPRCNIGGFTGIVIGISRPV